MTDPASVLGDPAGQLTQEEVAVVMELSQRTQQLVQQLGHLDLQMESTRIAIRQAKAETAQLSNMVVERLGLPEGTQLTLSTNGDVFVQPQQQGGT